MKRYIDGFVFALLAVVVLGILLPTSGHTAQTLSWATKIAIGVLFLLYGARLSTAEVLAGMRHWRLQLTVLALTFAVYPVVGVATGALLGGLLPEDLVTGFIFVTLLCATVQTCVSNTSIARGNVPAAIIAASTSSVLGVFVTPLLVAGVLATTGAAHVDLRSVVAIVTQLLLPFVAGQLLHSRLGGVLKRNGQALKRIDRGLILFAVFAAFSKGSGAGVWSSVPLSRFAVLLALCIGLLVVVMGIASLASRLLRLSHEDRAVVTFVGTSKSLAVGLPMATVLFADQEIALIILPLMFYHPVQMIICSFIAQRMSRQAPAEVPEESARSELSPAGEELLHRLHVPSGGAGGITCIAGGDAPAGTAPETGDVVAWGERHDDPRTPCSSATRMGMFAAGNVGALVADADARPAVERFATSARTVEDQQQLIGELRSAGLLDGGADCDEALAELLTAAGEHPIRVVGFDTRAGRSAGGLETAAAGVRRRLQTASPGMAAVVGRALAQVPAGQKVVALVGVPHADSVGAVDGYLDDTSIGLRNGNHNGGIDFHPGDAIYYPQHVSSAGAVVSDGSTMVYDPPLQHQPHLLTRPTPRGFTTDLLGAPPRG